MLEMSAVVRDCTPPNVSTVTMQQIVAVESTRRPHAIGYKLIRRVPVLVNGKTEIRKEVSFLKSQPRDVGEAIRWARYLQQQGYEFDAGAAQVHSTNFARYGLTVEAAFDACRNIEVSARILTECYERALNRFRSQAPALKAAISCYQSGDFETGFSTGYVQKVLAAPVASEKG